MSRLASRCARALAIASIFASSAVSSVAWAQDAAAPDLPPPPPVEPVAAPAPAQPPPAPVVAAPPAPITSPPTTPVAGSPGSVTQVASEPIPPRTDGRAIGACGTADLAAIRSRVEPAIVEIAGAYAWTLGFAFEEPDLVVAPIDVAGLGRGVEVTYGGRTMSATIAAVDEDAGLALLRVPGLHVAQPLTASTVPVQIGTATVGFSWSYEDYGTSGRKISDGSVSQLEGGRFAAGPYNGAGYVWGSPLLDCSGKVLGLSSWYGQSSRIAPAHKMNNKVKAGAAPYEGEWSLAPTFHALLEIDHTREAWGGADVGVAVVAYDKLELGLTARVLGRGDPDVEATESWSRREWGVRAGADVRAGYRLMLTEGALPFYLVPHVGLGFDYSVRGAESKRQGVTSTGCTTEDPCPVVTESRAQPTETRARAYPSIGMAARLGLIDLDYTFRLDTEDADRSSHQVGFGFQF
jgi:hypothetical protein